MISHEYDRHGGDGCFWGANVNGQTYTIDNCIPMQTLRQLEQYLLLDVRQVVINEAVAAAKVHR
jgi:hypothetical protein